MIMVGWIDLRLLDTARTAGPAVLPSLNLLLLALIGDIVGVRT
jgi:hypothetical protein